jgi:MSHA biogenesis protein MshN
LFGEEGWDMSVINQMLRDLDARQASSQERAGLPPRLRALPPDNKPGVPPWLLVLIGLLIGAAAVWFIAGQFSPPPRAPTNEPAPSQTGLTPAATAVERPSAAEVSATSSSPAPSETAAMTHESAPPAPLAPSRPIASMTSAEKPKAASATRTVATPKPEASGQTPRGQTAASRMNTSESIAAPPAAPSADTGGQIDKRPKANEKNDLAESEYRKGMQAASQGDHPSALPALRRALEIDPGHAKARQALLAVLANLRQWDEVKRVARQGLSLDPAHSGWATMLARLAYEEGDIDGALKTMEAHAAHAAVDADFNAFFGFLLQKRQRFADAAQHYQAALRQRPNEGRWWYGLGIALEAAGRGDDARAAFVKARAAGNLPAEMRASIEEKLGPPPSSMPASSGG